MRETVSDERGEFALPALPAGPHAIKIETNPNFGRITGVASTRTGQIGFRLTF